MSVDTSALDFQPLLGVPIFAYFVLSTQSSALRTEY